MEPLKPPKVVARILNGAWLPGFEGEVGAFTILLIAL